MPHIFRVYVLKRPLISREISAVLCRKFASFHRVIVWRISGIFAAHLHIEQVRLHLRVCPDPGLESDSGDKWRDWSEDCA